MNALVVYGTRAGTTQAIAAEIGKTLTEQGWEVTVRNAKDLKGIDVKAFDLYVVGSSIYATMWSGKVKGFLKKNQQVLATKKVALFTSGLAGGDPAQTDYAQKCIEGVAAKFPAIKPVAKACFGGVIDFNSPNLFARLMANAMKADFQKKGVDTSKPVDSRDWAAIRQWAAEVAAKAH